MLKKFLPREPQRNVSSFSGGVGYGKHLTNDLTHDIIIGVGVD